MALPKLLREIFENDGAGPKFRADKVPVDGALSATSKNPVQNKVINSALNGKLSTSGGTMTGDIIFSSYTGKIASTQNNGGMVLVSKNGADLLSNQDDFQGGATLLLRSSSYADAGQRGCFYLISALAPGQRHDLIGTPDGSLTWDGNRVRTVVSESYGDNSWYRKYSDGWIEQGGKTKGSDGVTLTFPLAFSNTNYSFVCNTQGNSTGYGYKRSAWIRSRTATTVTLGSDAGDPAVWYACGK